jgi:hypothetical protein
MIFKKKIIILKLNPDQYKSSIKFKINNNKSVQHIEAKI